MAWVSANLHYRPTTHPLHLLMQRLLGKYRHLRHKDSRFSKTLKKNIRTCKMFELRSLHLNTVYTEHNLAINNRTYWLSYVFHSWKSAIVGWNPMLGTDTRQCVVFVLTCVGRSSADGRLSVKGLSKDVRKKTNKSRVKGRCHAGRRQLGDCL
jgi:hypothetical protein